MPKDPPKTRAAAWLLLLRVTKSSHLLVLCAALLSVANAFFGFVTPQVMRVLLDSVLDDKPFDLPLGLNALMNREFLRQNLFWCTAFLALCALLAGAASYLCRMAMAKSGERTLRSLRDNLFDHISRLPYAWHIQNQTGDIIQRCTSDVETLKNFLAGQVLELFRVVMMISVALGLMLSMNPRLTVVTLAFSPLVVLYSLLFSKALSGRFRAADEAEGELSSVVQENLTGVRVVRAFGRETHEVAQFDRKNEVFTNYWIRFSSLLGSYWGLGDFVTALQVLAVTLLGVQAAVRGELTLGEFTVFVSYNAMLSWPMRSLGRVLGELSKTSVALGRLDEILREQTEQDDPNAQTPPMDRDIEFQDVSFRYATGPEVLKNISFTAKAGSTIGILGGTGSGKSTLACLLCRLYEPEAGAIRVGGVDIREIRRSHLRGNVGFVLQEPFLFSKSILENIKNARPDSPLEDVRRAAKTAAVDDAILGFAKGYDTVIGEKGVTLSGGQKQRVAIARMLLQGTSIQIFDDSLSAVDTETDAKIRAALKRDAASATTFIISHRVNSLRHADQILVLEEGAIAQQGTHEQLSAQEGIYRRVFELQQNVE